MRPTIILTSALLFMATSCDSNSQSESSQSSPTNTYQEAKMTLEEKEKLNPTEFLDVDGKYWQNLFNRWVVEGDITNRASVVTYKDVVLNISYYTKTDTHLGTVQRSIIEYFKPGTSQHFKFKTDGVDGTSKVKISIASATVVD